MTDTEYEELTARLATALARDAAEPPIWVRHGRKSQVPGKSGFPHQIDVAIRTQRRLFVAECKCWGDKVGVRELLTFAARVLDIRAASPEVPVVASMVTTKGYDSGCTILGSFFEVHVDKVASPHEYALTYGHHEARGDIDGAALSEQGLVQDRAPADGKAGAA